MAYIDEVLESVRKQNSEQPEFIQTVEEVLGSLRPVIAQNEELYRREALLERMVCPERCILFRVPWVDDQGNMKVNTGYRVQFNSAIGPYKGGLRFHPSVNESIRKCLIIRTKKVEANKIKTLLIEDALCGPQTPEKAKQSSFVSLDVRKKVLGHFDKKDEDCNLFNSILVISEASHWEDKSRCMIRLCNDHNLIVPDAAIISLFRKFKAHFGVHYQDKITKQLYQSDPNVRRLTNEVITEFNNRILQDMDTSKWVKFHCAILENGSVQLQVVDL